jgi:hypothetical protein
LKGWETRMIEIKRNQQQTAQQGAGRTMPPFTGTDQHRNYRAMYRAACDFHERHNPPRVEAAYWKSHIPGTDDPPPSEVEYWQRTAQDASDTATAQGNDPFLIGLLAAVYEELEREYEQRRKRALQCDGK